MINDVMIYTLKLNSKTDNDNVKDGIAVNDSVLDVEKSPENLNLETDTRDTFH